MFRAPAVLSVSLVVAGSLWACTDETAFTDEERATLSEYKLPDKPPANPSNKVADSVAAARLGKKLFFDKRFSGKLRAPNDATTDGSLGKVDDVGKVACADCHDLANGGGDRRSRTPTSLGASFGLRNAPTVINAAFWDVAEGGWQLWDGRKDSLWSLALGPMEGANEHNGSRLQFAHLIYDFYKAEYELAFPDYPLPNMKEMIDDGMGGQKLRFPLEAKPAAAGAIPQPINMAWDAMAMPDKLAMNRLYTNIGKALEAYQRLLVSPNFEPSAFDRMLAGDESAMSPAAIRGAKLFIGKAACNECHRGHMFTDFKFHNIGCPQQGLNVPTLDVGRQFGVSFNKNGYLDENGKPAGGGAAQDVMTRGGPFSDEKVDDHLRALDLSDTRTLGAFRTPTLRNVEKSQPYMHNGVYQNLWDVVAHYNFGGGTGSFSGQKESAISPLLLTNDEMDDLVEFLRSLSDGPPKAHPDFPEGLTTKL